MRAEMFAAVKVKQRDVAIRRDKTCSRRIMRCPKLHVCRVGDVTNVQRVERHQSGVVVLLQFANDAREAIFTQARHIWRRNPQRSPFVEGEISRADLYAVVVKRCPVGLEQRCRAAARGVDLAVGTHLIHGGTSLYPPKREGSLPTLQAVLRLAGSVLGGGMLEIPADEGR